jgi:ribonuclease R
MSIAESGKLTDFKFYEGVMYSHARLTYTKVAAMLDGDVELQSKYHEIFPHVVNLYELFKQLKQMRALRGAFEFETVEPKFIFNAQRKIDSVETVERNDAHKIIEECMILANVSAAQMLEKHDAGGLFRVHDKPDPSKLANFRSYLAEMGAELTFSNEPSPKELSEQINDYLSRPDGELIQTMMIRSMRQAVYQPDNIGHFGLALDGYAHFTSPIRRYPDLVVHRAIKGILKSQGQKPSGYKVYDDEELDELGEQCSKTERRADEATREVEAWLKCEFMLDHIDNEYEGVVSSVTSFGMFVRLKELHIEGLVHIAALGNDFFHYDSEKHLLVGERTRRTYRLGDDVTIRVANVSLDDKQIDFELASQPKGKRNQSDDGDSGRRKANISRTDNAAMSVREQLRKGHVPGKQKEAKVDKKTSGKKAKESLKKGKRKPKSRAAKRVAKKKSTNPKKKK